ncbi:MAG: hypothetical protein LC781_07630 [Actinobacteria bacterium]|nr:hypothetical protein [Actinomycetota bacterium]
MAEKVNEARIHQDKRRIYNPVQKDSATFLKTSEETGGACSLAEVEVAPGGGTRPHYHKTYAEHFEVIEAFLCEMRPGQPGFEKTIMVGYGLARDGFTRSDGTPKSLYHMALLLDWSEIRVPGVFTILEPLMRVLAKRARRKGIDRELEERYCS